MSFLSLCQYVLFYSQSSLRSLLSHWQCFGKRCCCPVAFTGWYYISYWYYLSCIILAGISKCSPISLIRPGPFSDDHSHWVFFHGLSGFPARISLVKFPLEPFWIPLKYQVYLWSAWCCNARVKASRMYCKIHELLQVLLAVSILPFICIAIRALQLWEKADLLSQQPLLLFSLQTAQLAVVYSFRWGQRAGSLTVFPCWQSRCVAGS